jgi:hypothetical protein
VTEAEWLACTDPKPMLEFLRGTASDRKLRLFAVACCRQTRRSASKRSHVLQEEEASVIEIVERCAERAITVEEMRSEVGEFGPEDDYDRWAIHEAAGPDPLIAASEAAKWTADHAGQEAQHAAIKRRKDMHAAWDEAATARNACLCRLLRDVIGNLFRPVALDPSWLKPNAVKLAQAIYDKRAFDRLPKLGDALEKAGCDDAEVLAHCRQPGQHERGCWVVDLILGKG